MARFLYIILVINGVGLKNLGLRSSWNTTDYLQKCLNGYKKLLKRIWLKCPIEVFFEKSKRTQIMYIWDSKSDTYKQNKQYHMSRIA